MWCGGGDGGSDDSDDNGGGNDDSDDSGGGNGDSDDSDDGGGGNGDSGGGGGWASPPTGGTTWSSSLGLVRFQIFLMMARSSSFASSMFPSVLILSEVLTSAKSVALNMTVPSVLSGMFIATRRCGGWQGKGGELR